MSDRPVNLSSGPPETVLDPEPPAAVRALDEALTANDPDQLRENIGSVVARYPTMLDGWARYGDAARDDVEAYAAYRVGYHRGLDRLRQNGWRGSGYVRWEHPENRGFLRALDGLRRSAAAIGEVTEEARCEQFLHQLDPSWPPEDIGRR